MVLHCHFDPILNQKGAKKLQKGAKNGYFQPLTLDDIFKNGQYFFATFWFKITHCDLLSSIDHKIAQHEIKNGAISVVYYLLALRISQFYSVYNKIESGFVLL